MAKFKNKENNRIVEVHSKNLIEQFKKDKRYEAVSTEKKSNEDNKTSK